MSGNITKSILVSMMFLFIQIIGLSQPCLPEGIHFTTQSQIDSFPIIYPSCTEIEGSVSVEGSSIHNLLGLNSITSIGGNLSIHANYNLESLNGLNNLQTIEGDLLIRSNFAITNLMGLENLSTVRGDIWFYNNALRTLDGLLTLDSVGGTFKISQNISLQNIHGMEDLKFIGGNLELLANDSLVNLDGIESLKVINGYIDLHYNDGLLSLSGLANLDFIGGSLHIYANDSLSHCAVESICEYLTSPTGSINIHDNSTGCNSAAEIKEICDTLDISENFYTNKWILYPNPAINKFTISNFNDEEVANVNIYNQLGQKVVSVNKVRGPIDILKLRMGFYIVEFTVNGNLIRERIAKL